MIFLGSTVDNVLVLDSLWNYRSKVCPVLVSWTVTDYRMPPKSCRTWDSSEWAETVLLVEWSSLTWTETPWDSPRQSSSDGGQCREASGWVVEDGEGYLTYRGMRRGRRQWTFSCPMMTSGCWEELAARKTRTAAPWTRLRAVRAERAVALDNHWISGRLLSNAPASCMKSKN